MDGKLKKWFEGKIWYDLNGTQIWAETKKDGCQHIVDIRGWGAIQHLFPMNQDGQNKAAKFQDEIGEFVASAIREKIARDTAKPLLCEECQEIECDCETNETNEN